MNSLPRPSPSLRASMVPPCISTSRRDSVRPMPRPFWLRRLAWTSRRNISKMRSSAGRAMPQPLSRTLITTLSPSRRADRAMVPPSSVYLAALLSRLPRICARRTGSPSSHSASPGSETSSRWPPAWTSGSLVSTALRTIVASSTRSRRSSSRPRVMRDISSRSSTRRTRWLTWRSMMSRIAGFGRSPCEAHEVQAVAQRRQRVAQLVRQRREELVLALVGLAQRGLRLLARGDVARGAEPLRDVAVRAEDRDGA